MYIPEHFAETDPDRIERLIAEHGFGLLMTVDSGRPYGSHLPFLKERSRLLCHLARSNPQVAQLGNSEEVLVIFSGPHAYVSPSWYASPAPPTWNYAVVHVYGKPTLTTDRSELQQHIERLAGYHEAREHEPWQPDYDPSMLGGIVGVEIAITEIQGKFKLSQNRPERDREEVMARLLARGSDSSVGTAELMRELATRK